MQSFAWYVRRLRTMDAAEVTWRIQRAARDQADMLRVLLGRIPRLPKTSVTSLVSFRPGFKCTPVTFEDWRGTESKTMSRWLRRLISKADMILENRLSYFDLFSRIMSALEIRCRGRRRTPSYVWEWHLEPPPFRHHLGLWLSLIFPQSIRSRYPNVDKSV